MVGNEVEAKTCKFCKVDFDRDKIIGCEGPCKGWFHLKCAKIRDKDFAVINAYVGLRRFCTQCITENTEQMIE